MIALPIDEILPEMVEAFRHGSNLALEAPPGAGKTTRVPMALFDAGVTHGADILVAQPRRLAARLAARRVAAERGETLGDLVGYSVRFESKITPKTRVHYVTQGVLLRRLLDDPSLRGVGMVVLDEFHERQLDADLSLALLRHLQRSRRDLRLIVMSATLEATPIAHFLGDCPRLVSEGQRYEVRVEHLRSADDRPLAKQIVSAVKRALQEAPTGDILAFVPGAGEIRQARVALEDTAEASGLDVVPLHGDLPVDQQARAVAPGRRRKVILSTNVAESSITVEGVTVVIDSGLARVASWSPWTGLPSLVTQAISRASAKQRAGRAGRTQPGVVYRLYTRGDYDRRPPQDSPEIARADLTGALLLLHGTGIDDPHQLRWLTPPPAASLGSAARLLHRLGALDDSGALTAVGRRMLKFPVHPRLARVLVEGERLGVASDVALAVALLSERDIRAGARTRMDATRVVTDARGPSDVELLCDRFLEATGQPAHRVRAMGLDPRAVDAVERTRKQLQRTLRKSTTQETEDAPVARSLLRGYPDRVARRRAPGSLEIVMTGGETARLSNRSIVHDAPFLLALDAEDRASTSHPGPAVVAIAARIDPDWLLESYTDDVLEQEELVLNPQTERVDRVRRLCYGSVVLDESRSPASPSPDVARVLTRAARAMAWGRADLDRLSARLHLVGEHYPELDLPELTTEVGERLLENACQDATTLAELRSAPLADRLLAQLSSEQAAKLRELVPEYLHLPGGRRLAVEYSLGQPPWVASRLQDFFGQAEGPRLLGGRVPVTLHLLAPNRRAVQVTNDLAGFWSRHYPALRRQLMRRYPKHDWPEDGATAVPPPPGRLRAHR